MCHARPDSFHRAFWLLYLCSDLLDCCVPPIHLDGYRALLSRDVECGAVPDVIVFERALRDDLVSHGDFRDLLALILACGHRLLHRSQHDLLCVDGCVEAIRLLSFVIPHYQRYLDVFLFAIVFFHR